MSSSRPSPWLSKIPGILSNFETRPTGGTAATAVEVIPYTSGGGGAAGPKVAADVHYNAVCTFCAMNKKSEALDALTKAWRNGFKDADWVRRDPSLAILQGDPEFEKLYPP